MPDSDKPILPEVHKDTCQKLFHLDEKIVDLLVQRYQILATPLRESPSKTCDSSRPHLHDLFFHDYIPFLEKLSQRVHDVPLHTASLSRVFCEIIAATSPQHRTTSIAVFTPSHEIGYLELCRNFYGTYVQTVPAHTTGSVIRSVATGETVLGIVPLPKQDDPCRWWPLLLSHQVSTPRIVARLPFTGLGHNRDDGLEALVLCCPSYTFSNDTLIPDSGRYRTLVSVETLEGISRASLGELFTKAGFHVLEMPDCVVPAAGARIHLIEINDHLNQDDPRLLLLKEGAPIMSLTILGGYKVSCEDGDE